MNKIDSYRFGQIIIDGKKYTSDVVILHDRVQANWRRHESHKLTLIDITGIIDGNPEALIVGTGAAGRMKVLPEVEEVTTARNIQLIIQPTGKACEIFNQLSSMQRMVAALHLTC
ncbi:MAG: hypothetical protein A2144_03330 [Chloroflexi bacterium RBG_16_50_9]|nr:MAG: hypothetical protein A2144_03330 [Chloroflexi bacterium RBG_16_50_9]